MRLLLLLLLLKRTAVAQEAAGDEQLTSADSWKEAAAEQQQHAQQLIDSVALGRYAFLSLSEPEVALSAGQNQRSGDEPTVWEYGYHANHYWDVEPAGVRRPDSDGATMAECYFLRSAQTGMYLSHKHALSGEGAAGRPRMESWPGAEQERLSSPAAAGLSLGFQWYLQVEDAADGSGKRHVQLRPAALMPCSELLSEEDHEMQPPATRRGPNAEPCVSAKTSTWARAHTLASGTNQQNGWHPHTNSEHSLEAERVWQLVPVASEGDGTGVAVADDGAAPQPMMQVKSGLMMSVAMTDFAVEAYQPTGKPTVTDESMDLVDEAQKVLLSEESDAAAVSAAAVQLVKAADLGDDVAMMELGELHMFNKPEGEHKDWKKAVSWYSKSASLGNAKAMYMMGALMGAASTTPLFERYVEKDRLLADKYLLAAARADYYPAQLALAHRMKQGVGRGSSNALHGLPMPSAGGNGNAGWAAHEDVMPLDVEETLGAIDGTISIGGPHHSEPADGLDAAERPPHCLDKWDQIKCANFKLKGFCKISQLLEDPDGRQTPVNWIHYCCATCFGSNSAPAGAGAGAGAEAAEAAEGGETEQPQDSQSRAYSTEAGGAAGQEPSAEGGQVSVQHERYTGQPLPEAPLALVQNSTSGADLMHKVDLELTLKLTAAAAENVLQETVDAGGRLMGERVRLSEAAGRGNGDEELPPGPEEEAANLEYLSLAAAQGDINAITNMAQINFFGENGVAQNYPRAHRYFTLAAAQHDPAATYNLGVMYQSGLGVNASNATAMEWFQKSRDMEYVPAFNALGVVHLNGLGVEVNISRAVREFQAGAELNCPMAQANLGGLYLQGVVEDESGVAAQNLSEAFRLFNASSYNGELSAMLQLGLMYMNGQGVNRSASIALSYFEEVAQAGRVGSTLLSEGWDKKTLEDHDGALLRYSLAAEMGFEIAQTNAAYLYKEGLVSLPPCWEAGQCAVGGLYADGRREGEPGSARPANAPPEGSPEAGELLLQRKAKVLRALARQQLQSAAHQGSAEADTQLGYEWQGEAAASDPTGTSALRAVAYWERGARQGSAESLVNLGWLEWSGTWPGRPGQPNLTKAVLYFTNATEVAWGVQALPAYLALSAARVHQAAALAASMQWQLVASLAMLVLMLAQILVRLVPAPEQAAPAQAEAPHVHAHGHGHGHGHGHAHDHHE